MFRFFRESLDFSRTFCGPSSQAMDTRLDALEHFLSSLGRPAWVSTRASFSRCFPIGCRPLFKLFGGDLGADGRWDLEDVLDLIIGQVGVDQCFIVGENTET